jgi:hypothetical protein
MALMGRVGASHHYSGGFHPPYLSVQFEEYNNHRMRNISYAIEITNLAIISINPSKEYTQ